ncbi:MAG: hypothetical protein Q8L75_08355 [Acidobacteriota bacterium]|nr:hypothetical protein [Acidobacteriota bacterium]
MSLPPGTRLGVYEILAAIGEGGMGTAGERLRPPLRRRAWGEGAEDRRCATGRGATVDRSSHR